MSVQVVAPARVNIIGEHTDYNGGFVLPMSTALFTSVTATPRADRRVAATSKTFNETRSFALDDIQAGENVSWVEYVKGVAAGLQEFGVELPGAELLIESDIPLGAGLSSSASLELAIAKALLAVAGAEIPPLELALLCQQAEHHYAGVHCGIMDQYTVACAEEGHAILLDCRSLNAVQVQLPADVGFILTDSGVRHRLPDGDYNDRAQECAAAVEILAQEFAGVELLRDVTADMIGSHKNALGEVLYRRCRHVVSENERVQLAVMAMESGDQPALGRLLNECHTSLNKDFEVSCDELEALVAAANASDLVLGSRMIGAGFGGCVLSLCHLGDVSAAADDIRENYAAVAGKEPWQHIVAPARPVRVIVDE